MNSLIILMVLVAGVSAMVTDAYGSTIAALSPTNKLIQPYNHLQAFTRPTIAMTRMRRLIIP